MKKGLIIIYASKISLILSNLKNDLWIFMPTGKSVRFLLVVEIESIVCTAACNLLRYTLFGIDL
jgi:uncharacterized membrane protein (DUF106 family)